MIKIAIIFAEGKGKKVRVGARRIPNAESEPQPTKMESAAWTAVATGLGLKVTEPKGER